MPFRCCLQVPDDMIALRQIVMARKEPRKLLIQPHMRAAAEGDGVELETFASTPVGMIESFVAVCLPILAACSALLVLTRMMVHWIHSRVLMCSLSYFCSLLSALCIMRCALPCSGSRLRTRS
jgi:hypothetical protein